MGDRKFTLIELHLDGDTQFSPGTIGEMLPIGGSDVETEDTALESEEDETETADEESGGRGSAVGALIALVVLAGIAVAAKKYTSDDEPAEQEAEPDVIVN